MIILMIAIEIGRQNRGCTCKGYMMNVHDGHTLVACLPAKWRQVHGLYTKMLKCIYTEILNYFIMCVVPLFLSLAVNHINPRQVLKFTYGHNQRYPRFWPTVCANDWILVMIISLCMRTKHFAERCRHFLRHFCMYTLILVYIQVNNRVYTV